MANLLIHSDVQEGRAIARPSCLKVGHAELDTLVVIDIFILRIAAVKDYHYDILYFFTNQCDQFA